jgi:hypothetical protein
MSLVSPSPVKEGRRCCFGGSLLGSREAKEIMSQYVAPRGSLRRLQIAAGCEADPWPHGPLSGVRQDYLTGPATTEERVEAL